MNEQVKGIVQNAKDYLMQLPNEQLNQVLLLADSDTLQWIIRHTKRLPEDYNLHKLSSKILSDRSESL